MPLINGFLLCSSFQLLISPDPLRFFQGFTVTGHFGFQHSFVVKLYSYNCFQVKRSCKFVVVKLVMSCQSLGKAITTCTTEFSLASSL